MMFLITSAAFGATRAEAEERDWAMVRGAAYQAPTIAEEVARQRQLSESGRFKANYGSVFLPGEAKTAAGKKKVALLLHGNRSTPKELQAMIDLYSSNGYTVYAPVAPGIGIDASQLPDMRHRHPITGAPEDMQWAELAFRRLAEHVGDDAEIHVVGVSRGGALARHVALQFGAAHGIARLILISPFYDIQSRAARTLHGAIMSLTTRAPKRVSRAIVSMMDHIPLDHPPARNRVMKMVTKIPSVGSRLKLRPPIDGTETPMTFGQVGALAEVARIGRALAMQRSLDVPSFTITTETEHLVSLDAIAAYAVDNGGQSRGHYWHHINDGNPSVTHSLIDPRQSDPAVAKQVAQWALAFSEDHRSAAALHQPR